MIISLIGYMGCGKTLISKELAKKINFKEIDLDDVISKKNNLSIKEIFEKKGELFFRKQEKLILEEILNTQENIILSVGGGTPCYFDNINIINQKSISFYLMASVSTLVKNLSEYKDNRPLITNISNENLPNFIGQHLFERNQFYHQAKYSISVDNWDSKRITNDILNIIRVDY